MCKCEFNQAVVLNNGSYSASHFLCVQFRRTSEKWRVRQTEPQIEQIASLCCGKWMRASWSFVWSRYSLCVCVFVFVECVLMCCPNKLYARSTRVFCVFTHNIESITDNVDKVLMCISCAFHHHHHRLHIKQIQSSTKTIKLGTHRNKHKYQRSPNCVGRFGSGDCIELRWAAFRSCFWILNVIGRNGEFLC